VLIERLAIVWAVVGAAWIAGLVWTLVAAERCSDGRDCGESAPFVVVVFTASNAVALLLGAGVGRWIAHRGAESAR
jgi:hypothetical protein